LKYYEFPIGTGSTENFSSTYSYEAPELRLQRLVKLVMVTGQIVALAPLGTVNSSHSFSFEGPQVHCQGLPKTNTTKDVQGDAYHHELVFSTDWSGARWDISSTKIILSTSEVKGYFLALNQSAPAKLGSHTGPDNRTMSLVIEHSVIECNAYQAKFNVDFRYERGVQMIKYNTDAESELLFQTILGVPKDGDGNPQSGQQFLEWVPTVLHWNHIASCYAIFEAVGRSLTYSWNEHFMTRHGPHDKNGPGGTYQLLNGSDVAMKQVIFNLDPEIVKSKPSRCRISTLLHAHIRQIITLY
jgi:hypothetical protein